ncbi:MAG: protein-disulfide reductase DsbD family protein [Alphaproteobacteria bacterium]
MRIVILIISLFLSGLTAHAAESERVDTGFVQAQLISTHSQVAPGQTFHIGLRTVLDPHWHTYWKNPGDSGEPVQITWDAPQTLSHGDIIWPLPDTVPTGPIVNYGFEGRPVFPVAFEVSKDAVVGEVLSVDADVYYLVCKDICVPEDAKLSLDLTVGEPVIHERGKDLIGYAIQTAPKRGTIKSAIAEDGDDVVISFENLPEGADISGAHFFPYAQGVLDHSAPQKLSKGKTGFTLRTTASYDWENGTPETAAGVLRFSQDGAPMGQEVLVEIGGDMPSTATQGAKPSTASGLGLWGAIIGAFIGGLILNLMPCVFPVISIKALSIAKQAHSAPSQVRREGWIYTAGVVATFLVLTAILLGIKAAGNQIGWGFQLQSPQVIAALAILLFLVGLNLLGTFDIGTGLQNTGGSLTQKSGGAGTFFTGALAVIVATPCTAPFMAGAIGYALAQPAIITFAVFMALALGFAAPFLLLSYMPRLLSTIPKPGPWMVRFREFLAFPMFGAVVWLLWVLTQQAGEKGLLIVLASMLLFGFAIWLYKGGSIITRLLAAIAVIGAVSLPFALHPKSVELTYSSMEAWSTERVAELQAEGQAVFIDFTAAWCVTCKANKKLVLDKPDVQAIFQQTNTAFLVADWTNKNDVIARELASHGRSGVPLYLYYPAGNNAVKPQILPQLLTKSVIREVLTSTQ